MPGALLFEQAQHDHQDGAELRLDRRPQVAEEHIAIGLDRGVIGPRSPRWRLIVLDDLQQEHDAFVEPPVLGQQPLDLAVPQHPRCRLSRS